MATVEVRPNPAALRQLLSGTDGGIARDTYRRGLRVEAEAKRRCPVDTGRLRSSITLELVIRGDQPVARVGTVVNYAIFVHEGTGVYGPTGARITPRRGRYLVFTPRGASRPVFARSVVGSPGVPFLRDALRAAAS